MIFAGPIEPYRPRFWSMLAFEKVDVYENGACSACFFKIDPYDVVERPGATKSFEDHQQNQGTEIEWKSDLFMISRSSF